MVVWAISSIQNKIGRQYRLPKSVICNLKFVIKVLTINLLIIFVTHLINHILSYLLNFVNSI